MSPFSQLVPLVGADVEGAVRALAEALPQALFTTDVDGRITYWNRAAERITGWSSAEALGRECSLLAGDVANGCDCGVGPLRCGMAERGLSAKSCTARAKDGRMVTIVKNAVPLLDGERRVVGALETFTELAPVRGGRTEARDGASAGDCCGLTGRHPRMRELYRVVELVARSEANVVILGESGTGKERVAEAIHLRSRRADGPFVRVSCSVLDERLLESELFGGGKGTSGHPQRRGRFEEADGGTLLLDEIGDLSPGLQLRLLRVVEQRRIERVEDARPVEVDARLLCTSHRDMKALVRAGRFRADLYFRLAAFPVDVPTLRDRLDDLPLLAESLLAGPLAPPDPPCRLSGDALAALRAYPWPGNVRELRNVLELALLRSEGGEIRAEHLSAEVRAVAAARQARLQRPVPGAARPLDREAVFAALDACGWNRARAARHLGVSRVTLWKRMKGYGIADPQ